MSCRFADALTGAPLAGAVGGPLYLASTSCIPTAAAAGIWNGGTVGLWLIGGTGVLD
ncbi:cell wall-binding repeat-containing protein [Microbacterium sp.]|uniref:cell wall-binding repeat-containing protein n=1 Tax=Microbacterium sp. TaxID=51671 RepID=UPI001AC5DF32|nr:cell wall-binding repeat-containing protein [Microbacterium sp.]MBN9188480.1 cell wall-binding repeat-containing protein [Microbacterium sp.]MBN9192653.1 cell wall-binding repeat-containing protein [Microbacterium sp.]